MIKDEAYVVNRDEYANVGTHWFVIYAKNGVGIYFNSFIFGSHTD